MIKNLYILIFILILFTLIISGCTHRYEDKGYRKSLTELIIASYELDYTYGKANLNIEDGRIAINKAIDNYYEGR